MENEKQEISLELKPEVAKGEYSNLAIITHSKSEFIIDFAKILPGIPKPEITNRLIMTPDHAKQLLMALRDNIVKYESIFGNIDIEMGNNSSDNFNIDDFGPFNNGPKS